MRRLQILPIAAVLLGLGAVAGAAYGAGALLVIAFCCLALVFTGLTIADAVLEVRHEAQD